MEGFGNLGVVQMSADYWLWLLSVFYLSAYTPLIPSEVLEKMKSLASQPLVQIARSLTAGLRINLLVYPEHGAINEKKPGCLMDFGLAGRANWGVRPRRKPRRAGGFA